MNAFLSRASPTPKDYLFTMSTDTLRRFILELPQIRGSWVHLDQTWQTMLACAAYPQPVQTILGEALTAAVLLATTIKYKGLAYPANTRG